MISIDRSTKTENRTGSKWLRLKGTRELAIFDSMRSRDNRLSLDAIADDYDLFNSLFIRKNNNKYNENITKIKPSLLSVAFLPRARSTRLQLEDPRIEFTPWNFGPFAPSPIPSLTLSLPGLFAPGNGTFAPWFPRTFAPV